MFKSCKYCVLRCSNINPYYHHKGDCKKCVTSFQMSIDFEENCQSASHAGALARTAYAYI